MVDRLILSCSLLLLGCGSTTSSRPDSATPALEEDAAPVIPVTSDAAVEFAPPWVDANGDVRYPVTFSDWPGNSTVTYASAKNGFGVNLSGLVYEPATATADALLWAVQNEPSKIHRLTWDGTAFTRTAAEGWVTGKTLRYPGGTGSPDSEGLTRTDWAALEMYVVAERDNDDKDDVRQSILRYELVGTKGVLDATHEWNLTNDLPATENNSGLEGIAWVPDTYLVERGFYDESKQAAYDPAAYPNHGAGIFLVGVDATGTIFAYALDHVGGTFTRLATFASMQSRSVDLVFDRDLGVLWSLCDNNCNARTTMLEIETDPLSGRAGRFVLRATLAAPKAIKDLNVEGFAIAPDSECANNRKNFFWSDDKETSGYALRKATIPCGRFF